MDLVSSGKPKQSKTRSTSCEVEIICFVSPALLLPALFLCNTSPKKPTFLLRFRLSFEMVAGVSAECIAVDSRDEGGGVRF